MRSRSQALINDELLIDFNADTVWHYQKYGFDWEKISGCLVTHSHSDHLYIDDIAIAAEAYSNKHNRLDFFAAESGYNQIKKIEQNISSGISVTLIEAGKRFTVANDAYTVMPMRANHDLSVSPIIYSISCGGKRLLYAHDTGVFLESTWELIQNEKYFDMISLDCTGCLGLDGGWVDGHMNLRSNIDIINRMKQSGVIDNNTIVVANHFSHNGGQVYDEMLEEAAKHNIIISYDGLEIEF